MTRRNNRRFRNSRLPCRNIVNQTLEIEADTGDFTNGSVLIEAPTQSIPGAPYTVTVGNCVINMTLAARDSTGFDKIDNLAAFLFFVPEGYSWGGPNPAVITKHPEWILAYKYLGSPTAIQGSGGQAFQPFRITSRKRRRLQTGDKIYLLITGHNSDNQARMMDVNALLTWSSRIN